MTATDLAVTFAIRNRQPGASLLVQCPGCGRISIEQDKGYVKCGRCGTVRPTDAALTGAKPLEVR